MKQSSVWSLTLAATIAGGALFGGTAVWTPGVTSLADGAVNIEYSGDNISRMTVKIAGSEKLTVTGEDAMPFAADACVVVSNGTIRFETPITGEGALKFQYVADSVVWDAVECGRKDYLPASESEAVVVASGVKLEDISIDHGAAGSKGLEYYYGAGDTNVKPYFIERGDGTFSCQMQHLSDNWNKCIFLNLKQVGDDVVAWTPSAAYADYSKVAPLGIDFRTIKYSNMNVSSVANQKNGYGLDGLTLVPINGDAVCVEVANGMALASGGKLTVGAGLTFLADGPTALASDGVWNSPMHINGTFKLVDPNGVKMGGQVTFGKYGRYEGRAENALPSVAAGEMDAPKWPSGSWAAFATNVSLSAVTGVTAKSGGGGWFDSGIPTTLNRAWIENDGQLLTVQFCKNWDGQWLKGVVYQIRQVGIYLQHRILRSAYYDKDVDIAKLDLRTQGSNMGIYNGGANGNSNGYGLQDIKIQFNSYTPECVLNLTNTFNTDPTGYTYFEGLADAPLYVVCNGAGGMPAKYEIGPHAYFDWNGNGFGGNRDSSMQVDEDGEFAIYKGWGWDVNMTANINGGIFHVFPLTSSSSATSIYMGKVNFTNGGHVADNIPRTGYYLDPLWTVRGNKPAYVDKGLAVVGNGEGTGSPFNRAVRFDVDDVTGSDDPDLYINGNIYYSNDEWKMVHIVKLGPGKVQHNGVMSANTYPIVISNGTWQVTQSKGIVNGCGLELSGGALELNANCSLSLGTLLVGAGSTSSLKLNGGSTIAFSGITEASGATVNIVGADEKAVRIGTTACLTAAQRRCLKIDGRRVYQDENGYLLQDDRGMVLFLK